MIRIGLPAPTLMRLRLRAQITARELSRQAESIREGVLTTFYNDLAVLRRVPHTLLRRRSVATPPLDACALMPAFEEHYQGLVDLLCWSAKDGVHDGRDERYAQLRAWFLQNYPALRPSLAHYLETEPEDTAPVEDGLPTPRDAFESLFLPENVDAIINSDTVISRIMRTRCALDGYREQMEAEHRS